MPRHDGCLRNRAGGHALRRMPAGGAVMSGWSHWLLFAAAGALGSLSRLILSSLIGNLLGGVFPWGIFLTNLLGCFLFGMAWAAAGVLHLLGDAPRLIILTGFMGAFTTFSTFIFDCRVLLEQGQWLLLACNICGQIALGLLALHAGIRLVSALGGA